MRNILLIAPFLVALAGCVPPPVRFTAEEGACIDTARAVTLEKIRACGADHAGACHEAAIFAAEKAHVMAVCLPEGR